MKVNFYGDEMGKIIRYTYDPDNPPEVRINQELENMSDEEIHERALSDPDALPLTEEQLKRFKRVNPHLRRKKTSDG